MESGISRYANLTDTGQWRLIVSMSAYGIAAILKNLADPDMSPILLLKKERTSDDTDLLSFIESAVYDNPRMLEDFATHIVITSSKALWIPADLMEDDEFDSSLFTCVYPVKEDDIFADSGDEEVCLYSLAEGLNSFVHRTLPGCKISSHLTVLRHMFEEMEMSKIAGASDARIPRSIYVNVDDNLADVFVFNNGRFISGCSHIWKEHSDIAYDIMLAADNYNLDIRDCDLILSGNETISNNILSFCSDFFNSVSVVSQSPLAREYGLGTAIAAVADESDSTVQK